jgi:hypothetical protein
MRNPLPVDNQIKRALPLQEAPLKPRAIFVLTVNLLSVFPKFGFRKIVTLSNKDDRRGNRSSKGGEKDLPFSGGL